LNQKDKILITGSTGLLGQALVKLLLQRGFSNLVLCMRPESVIPSDWELSDALTLLRGDMMDYFQVDDWVDGVDYIFHLAGSTASKAGSREALIATNITMTRTWVNVAIEHQIKGFVHVSSAAALGRKKDGTPSKESDSWQKNEVFSDYNKSKFLGELEVARAQQEGLNTLILNPTFLVGSGGILSWVISRLKRNFNDFPNGSGGYVHVEDVVHFALEAVDKELWGEKFIVNGENMSHESFFRLVATSLGFSQTLRPTKSLFSPLRPLLRFWPWNGTARPDQKIDKEWFRILQSNLSYDTSKAQSTRLVDFTPIQETVDRICKSSAFDPTLDKVLR